MVLDDLAGTFGHAAKLLRRCARKGRWGRLNIATLFCRVPAGGLAVDPQLTAVRTDIERPTSADCDQP